MTHWPWNAVILIGVLAAINGLCLFAGWRLENHHQALKRGALEHRSAQESQLVEDVERFLKHQPIRWDQEDDYD